MKLGMVVFSCLLLSCGGKTPSSVSVDDSDVVGIDFSDASLLEGDYEAPSRWIDEINADVDVPLVEGDLLMDEVGLGAPYLRARKWPNKVFNVTIIRSYAKDRKLTRAVAGALQELRQKIPEIKVKSDPKSFPMVVISRARMGCFSQLGYRGIRKQTVNIGRGCANKGIVVHELLHALGIHHEHVRPDRDKYIKIHLANILPRYQKVFRKSNRVGTWFGFDIGSVMMYPPRGFSKNGKPTITLRNGKLYRNQIRGLSKSDVKTLRRFYR